MNKVATHECNQEYNFAGLGFLNGWTELSFYFLFLEMWRRVTGNLIPAFMSLS